MSLFSSSQCVNMVPAKNKLMPNFMRKFQKFRINFVDSVLKLFAITVSVPYLLCKIKSKRIVKMEPNVFCLQITQKLDRVRINSKHNFEFRYELLSR